MDVYYNGQHSLYFGDMGIKRNNTVVIDSYPLNTWVDWHLIPASRPVVNPPSIKTNMVDIIGANGPIDLTDAPRGFPSYGTRTGGFDFYVDHTKNLGAMRVEPYDWTEAYSRITSFLHGRRMKVYLRDDLKHYYCGRFEVDAWKSDKMASTISIKYVLDPYAYNTASIQDTAVRNPITGEWDEDLTDNLQDVFTVDTSHFSGAYEFRMTNLLVGSMPVIPSFAYTTLDGQERDLYASIEWSVNGYRSEIQKIEGYTRSPLYAEYVACPELEIAVPFLDSEATLTFYTKDDGGNFVPSTNELIFIDFRRGRL